MSTKCPWPTHWELGSGCHKSPSVTDRSTSSDVTKKNWRAPGPIARVGHFLFKYIMSANHVYPSSQCMNCNRKIRWLRVKSVKFPYFYWFFFVEGNFVKMPRSRDLRISLTENATFSFYLKLYLYYSIAKERKIRKSTKIVLEKVWHFFF